MCNFPNYQLFCEYPVRTVYNSFKWYIGNNSYILPSGTIEFPSTQNIRYSVNNTIFLLEDGLFLRALEKKQIFKLNIYFKESPCHIGIW